MRPPKAPPPLLGVVLLAVCSLVAVAPGLTPAARAADTFEHTVASDNPSAWWRLGEATGTTARPAAGTVSGTYLNGVTLGGEGAIVGDPSTSAALDGVNDTISFPNSSALGSGGSFTVEAWARVSTMPTSSSTILRKDGQYQLRLNSSGSVTFRMWKGVKVVEASSKANLVAPGDWHAVAGTWDGTTMRLYVDGALKASTPLATPADVNTNPMYAGSTWNSYDYLDGSVDEVAVYPTALSADRLAAHASFTRTTSLTPFAASVTSDSPGAWWRLGEATGTSAKPAAGPTSGSYLNGVTLGGEGAVTQDPNTSVTLDGVDDTIRFPSDPSLGTGGPFTVEAWTRVATMPTTGASILRKDGQYHLQLDNSGRVSFRMWKGGKAVQATSSPSTLLPGDWHAVAGTWDGTTMRLYVDGALKASTPLASPADVNPNPMFAGSTWNSYDYLNGSMDEVSIYPSALAADRLGAHASFAQDVAPIVSVQSPASGTTQDERPNIGGRAGSGPGDASTVTVRLYEGSSAGGTVLQTMRPERRATGVFSTLPDEPLSPGTYTVQVEQEDSGGKAGRSKPVTFTVEASGDPKLLAAGDIAGCDEGGDGQPTAALLDRLPGKVQTLGDNAYDSGSPAEFRDCFDPSWGRHLARMRAGVGGHEYRTPGAAGYFSYFGEKAGPSDLGYYSYDIGAWHVVVLNTQCDAAGGCHAGSPQVQWLRADLASHPAPCTLAVIDEPRFSSGTVHGSHPDMEPFWDALYAGGAELVLSGDDHHYERFAPQTPSGQLDTDRGIRQLVVGTGGHFRYKLGPRVANSEVSDASAYGLVELSLHDRSYDWRFVPEAGKSFTDSGSTQCHSPDRSAPTSSASSPASTTSGAFAVEYSAKDDQDGTGVARVDLFAKGPGDVGYAKVASQIDPPATGSFSYMAPTDGSYSFYTVATDHAGNTETATGQTTTVVDTLAPQSSASAPATSRSTAISVGYSTADGGSGVASVDLYASRPGESGFTKVASKDDPGASGAFDYTAETGSGTYRFYTVARDRAANVQATPAGPGASTQVDALAPSSRASAPNGATDDPAMTVSYTASDDPGGSGLDHVDLYVRKPGQSDPAKVASQTGTATSGSFAYTADGGDGTYAFYTVAVDTLGNSEDAPADPDVNRLLDRARPDSQANPPARAATRPFAVPYTAEDAGGSGVTSVDLYAKGPSQTAFTKVGTDASPQASGEISLTPADGNGTYSFYTVAADRAGNAEAAPTSADGATSYTLDTSSPTSSAGTLTRYVKAFPPVPYTADDTGGSGLASVELWARTPGSASFAKVATDASPASGHVFDYAPTSDGTYSLYTVAVDKQGNRESARTSADPGATTTVDSVAPTAFAMADPGAVLARSVALALSTSPSDPGSGVASVRYQYAKAGATKWSTACTATKSPWSCNWDTVQVGDARYDLRAVATDKAGNASTTATVTGRDVDNTKPTATKLETTNRTGGTAGKAETDDSVSFTYSEPIRPASIMAGWSGTSTAVQARFVDGWNDRLEVRTPDGATRVALANPVRLKGDYVPPGGAEFAATMERSSDGTSIVVTLGALSSGGVRPTATGRTIRWAPDTTATDLAGNRVANTAVSAAGPAF